MRRLIAAFILAACFPVLYTPKARHNLSGATVTYSKSSELTCTDNATLNGNLCYCNLGFKVSGAQCVKDDPPTPPPHRCGEIYQDIASAIAFNMI